MVDRADEAGDRAEVQRLKAEVKRIFPTLSPPQQKLFDEVCVTLDDEYEVYRELDDSDDEDPDYDEPAEQEQEQEQDQDPDPNDLVEQPRPARPAVQGKNQTRALPRPASSKTSLDADLAERQIVPFPGGILAIVIGNDPIIMVDTNTAPAGLAQRINNALDFLY
jgi:hypothetical protein